MGDFALFDTSPLTQFWKFNNFLWVCWFLCKNLYNFVPPLENSTTCIAIMIIDHGHIPHFPLKPESQCTLSDNQAIKHFHGNQLNIATTFLFVMQVLVLKSVQVVMVRLHIFPIFSFLAKMLSFLPANDNILPKWNYRKNMQALW